MDVKIVKDVPPNYNEILKRFNVEHMKIVFTYGATIYNPSGIDLPFHVIAHERVHCEQQQYDDDAAKLWWERYLSDTEFMLDVEAEAYAVQYLTVKQVTDEKQSKAFLEDLATLLSSEIYGNPITFHQALTRIRHKVKLFTN